MKKNTRAKNSGLRRLVERGRSLFRIRENTDHYSDADYREAEKKFVKLCILEGRCGSGMS